MIEDQDDMYHVLMTCMVLKICGKIHKSDFSTLSAWHCKTLGAGEPLCMRRNVT